jgi:hypothetical protein
MLTEAAEERKAFEEQERMRQYARDNARIKARCDLIRRHKVEFFGNAKQASFERLLEACEKDAHEIACEAGEDASRDASRTELSVAAYEVAYIEAYADALPALVAAALAML